MHSVVKVEFEHRTESHPIKLVSEYVIRDVVQTAVGCASIASGRASSSTGGCRRKVSTYDRPFVERFGQHQTRQATRRRSVRKDADHIRPATYLLVEPSQRVANSLGPVALVVDADADPAAVG